MKQLLSMLSLMLFLTGCSAIAAPAADEKKAETGNEVKAADNQKETAQKEQNQDPQSGNTPGEYQPNPQVTDDRSLIKVGQTHEDDKGKATLKAIKDVNQTYKAGPIELTVKEMKEIHLRPSYGMIDYFHVLTHEEEFDFVKLAVEIKNTSSEQVSFAPVALLKTNTGETFDWEKDIYLEDLNGQIAGKETKAGNLGFIVNAEGGHGHEGAGVQENHHENGEKDIKWIEITTSDVFDKNEKKIADSQKIKIEF